MVMLGVGQVVVQVNSDYVVHMPEFQIQNNPTTAKEK